MSETSSEEVEFSHQAHLWFGLAAGMLLAVWTFVRFPSQDRGLLTFVVFGGGGVIVGNVLYLTRRWARRNHTFHVLQLALAFAVAALTVSDVARWLGYQSIGEWRQALEVVPGAAVILAWSMRLHDHGPSDPQIDSGDVVLLLAILGFCVASGFALYPL